MLKWDGSNARHLLMRLALGFVLIWFGVQELRSPAEWAVFVPAFISDHSPIAVNDLILIHGFLLLLAAAAIVLGIIYVLGCLLAVGLLSEVILGLWLDGGITDLVIRDVGLLALAAALALDPVRFWHLEGVLSRRLLPARPHPKAGKARKAQPLPRQASWPLRLSGGVLIVLTVLGLASLLHATGTSDSPQPQDHVASLATDQVQPSPTPEPDTSSASAATRQRFADWPYQRYAFQVYPGPISPEAQKALAGFDVTVQDQGDKVLLLFKALTPGYHDATVSVDKRYTAYFIETSMRDDPNSQENNMGDDGVIVVDTDGYMVQS
jgi:hypothetical protein